MTYDELIEHFGGLSEAARSLGLIRQTVHGWRDGVPLVRQMQIETLTHGALRADPVPALPSSEQATA